LSKERSLKIGLAAIWAAAVIFLVVFGLKLLNDFILVPRGVSPLAVPRAPVERKELEINVFFADENATRLVPEKRRAMLGDRGAADAGAIVAELIKGPQSDALLPTIPSGTRLLDAYKVGDMLVLDFTHDIQTNHTGGSTGELLTVYSIVNSLAHNLDGIERVQLLVEGEEMESLAGHLDLKEPLSPNLRWSAA
jgi:germination protein M